MKNVIKIRIKTNKKVEFKINKQIKPFDNRSLKRGTAYRSDDDMQV